MKISIVGCGYVGLCTGIGMAYIGHNVIAVDHDKEKVKKINSKLSPLYENGLQEMLEKVGDRFRATTDIREIEDTDVTFIAVGTPSRPDGSIDTLHVENAARDIGLVVKDKDKHIVVVKSTVIPGTCEKVSEVIEKTIWKKLPVVMNPEFLREGSALKDFLEPDSIVIGGEADAVEKVSEIYASLGKKILRVSLRTAEMIKYAKNAYLAKDISFANEMANICERMGVDYEEIKKGLKEDRRIGTFLDAGIGYGGSCFPKDVLAIISAAGSAGYDANLLKEAHELNERQKLRIVRMLERITNVSNKSVGILGLAFKPGTDDMREAPSAVIIEKLLLKGASISVYDPKAMENARRIFGNAITYSTMEECLQKDIILVLTEWDEFRSIKPDDVNTIIIDGRRVLDAKAFLKAGKEYYAIGLGR